MAIVGLNVPDGIIEDGLQKALEFIRKDYNDAVDKTKSMLHLLTSGVVLGSFDYNKQMIKSLITTEKDAHHIRVQQGYNPNDRKYPGVYINLADEQDSGSSLGAGEGDHGLEDGQDDAIFDDDATPNATERAIFANRFDAKYYITILSDNRNEVLGLYQFFKSIAYGIRSHFEHSGLQNMKLGGAGHVFDSRIPEGIYLRAMNMSFNYEAYSYDLYPRVVPSTINLTGTMLTLK